MGCVTHTHTIAWILSHCILYFYIIRVVLRSQGTISKKSKTLSLISVENIYGLIYGIAYGTLLVDLLLRSILFWELSTFMALPLSPFFPLPLGYSRHRKDNEGASEACGGLWTQDGKGRRVSQSVRALHVHGGGAVTGTRCHSSVVTKDMHASSHHTSTWICLLFYVKFAIVFHCLNTVSIAFVFRNQSICIAQYCFDLEWYRYCTVCP